MHVSSDQNILEYSNENEGCHRFNDSRINMNQNIFWFKLTEAERILTHIAKSWKIFPKIGWWLRGFLGKFFQTFFKISDFGSWVRSFSGKFFQPNFLSTYSGKKFVFWFRVMSEELFWKIFPASFYECLLRKKVCSHYLGMTRTTQKCVRCNAGCCTTHSRIICSQCYDS